MPPTPDEDVPGLAPGAAEVLQAATRVLAGVALRSLDALDSAVTLPQLRLLAVLADLGPVPSGQVARTLGLDRSTVTRLAPADQEAVTAALGLVLGAAGDDYGSPPTARCPVARHMASLMPARISQALTGQAVKNPAIIPACIKNQYTGLSGCRSCGAGKKAKVISAIQPNRPT